MSGRGPYGSNIKLPSLDLLFSTEEQRQEAKLEKVQQIPLDQLFPFPDHPFQVRDDEEMLRRNHLQQHHRVTYTGMLLSGKLIPHLQEIDRQAAEMEERLTAQLARQQNVTEQLKASDQLRWVGLMNNIKAAAEEIVLNELIYT